MVSKNCSKFPQAAWSRRIWFAAPRKGVLMAECRSLGWDTRLSWPRVVLQPPSSPVLYFFSETLETCCLIHRSVSWCSSRVLWLTAMSTAASGSPPILLFNTGSSPPSFVNILNFVVHLFVLRGGGDAVVEIPLSNICLIFSLSHVLKTSKMDWLPETCWDLGKDLLKTRRKN